MPKQSMAQTQVQWENLLAGIKINEAELPHVEIYSAPLDVQLAGLKAELARRSALQAEVRRSTRTILQFLKAGRSLGSRIGSYLKACYGFDSERLVEFGLEPRKRRQGRNDLRKEENGAPWNPTVPFK
jgi:hypothetical protein